MEKQNPIQLISVREFLFITSKTGVNALIIKAVFVVLKPSLIYTIICSKV